MTLYFAFIVKFFVSAYVCKFMKDLDLTFGHLYVQEVAVKQLDRNGLQGNREFLVEVLMLSLLHHQNLVNLIGYCADGDQRLLVYEYMPLGALEDHLLGKIPRACVICIGILNGDVYH